MARGLGAAVFLAVGLFPATSAHAAVSCERVAQGLTLRVEMDQFGDRVTLRLDGVEIAVLEGFDETPISCDGGGGLPPTTNNTDKVRVRERAGGATVRIDDPAAFAPGATDAGNDAGPATTNEVEFKLTSKGSHQDHLVLRGSPGDDYLRFGRNKVNPNAGEELPPDSDLSWQGFEYLEVVPGEGDDILTGAGSAGTGKPLRLGLHVTEQLGVDTGDDTLVGGIGPDSLAGGHGDDGLSGKRGRDSLRGGPGADLVSGGTGRDGHFYTSASGDVFVDIGVGGANDGSAADGPALARDEITASVEFVSSSISGLSTLVGDENANGLYAGGPGPSTLIGRGGDDLLYGAEGTDIITGSAGDDLLFGGQGPDTLTGSGGRDRLLGRSGPDQLFAADGIRDREISCGSDDDSAEVDSKDPKPKSC